MYVACDWLMYDELAEAASARPELFRPEWVN
jgi:hypothetical protein